MQKAKDKEQLTRILVSLGLSIVAGVIAGFAMINFLEIFGLINDGEGVIRGVIFSWAIVTAILYVVLSVRSLKQGEWGITVRLGRNIVVAVLGGFLFTIATGNSYSNVAFYNNLSFLTSHIFPIWFFVAFVITSVFTFDYSWRQRSSQLPKTTFVKPVSS